MTESYPARIKISYISVNRIMTLNSDMEEVFQELRQQGCRVRYASRIPRLFSIDYYGIEIEGSTAAILRFQRWLQEQGIG